MKLSKLPKLQAKAAECTSREEAQKIIKKASKLTYTKTITTDWFMINWSSTDIITAVIGFVGIISTAVIVSYSFKRNRTGNGRYQ